MRPWILFLSLTLWLSFACDDSGDGDGDADSDADTDGDSDNDGLLPESGTYVVREVYGHDSNEESALMAIVMDIDMGEGTVRFRMEDESEVTVSLSAQERVIACCCTMVDCMEACPMTLSEDPLVLETMEFSNPVLMVSLRDYSSTLDPGWILLREDDGSVLYEYYVSKHILFEKQP